MDNNRLTKVDSRLQRELAEYGIVRRKVMDKAPPKANGQANFFGFKDTYDEAELKFDVSPETIQENGMKVGMAVPDNKSFNLLVTQNFTEAIKTVSESGLRAYLRRVIDKV
jgi:hypothetical protein